MGVFYSVVMHKKKLFSLISAILLGSLFGAIVKIAYALPSPLPTTGFYMYLITSPLGMLMLDSFGGKAGVLIAVLIKAAPNSMLIGIVAGITLHNINCQRTFFYSTLWLPMSNAILGYISIFNISDADVIYLPKLQEMFGSLLWQNFCIYSWFILSLFISFIVSRRIMQPKP